MKLPPFEKKIVSTDPSSRKGLGDFLKQVAQAEGRYISFAKENKDNLQKVRGLLDQATLESGGDFQRRREGNEVLANCENRVARLVDSIGKSTANTPVRRAELVAIGMASEVNPELAIVNQRSMVEKYRCIKEGFPEVLNEKARELSKEDTKDSDQLNSTL